MLRGLAFVIAFAIAFQAQAAPAERRVALVIGNGAYVNAAKLTNPANDARIVSEKLHGLGFEVVAGIDLNKAQFDQKIREFAKLLATADTAVLFYAGHGMQVAGVNYLLPIDAALESERDLQFEATPLDVILKQMELDRESKTNIVFLDACRDNPLSRSLARSMGTRSAAMGRGLAQTNSGVGTFISYSTQPGNVALDGSEANSPFTSALARHISAVGRPITSVMTSVRKDVMTATGGKQVPWDNSSLTGDFFFAPEAGAVPEVPAAPSNAGEIAALTKRMQDLEAQLRATQPTPQQQQQVARHNAAIAPVDAAGASQLPIDNLYRAWRTLDPRTYAAQWAPEAVKVDLKSGKRKGASELAKDRVGLFGRLQSAQAMYSPILRSSDEATAQFDVTYSLRLNFKNGKSIQETACERYTVGKRGDAWLILLNEDYAPCAQ
jgi:uncharacterized caspase-like protein